MRLPVLSVGRRIRLQHVKHAVEEVLRPGDRVLDAGCSDGRLAAGLARSHRSCEFLGVDVDDAALARARREAASLPNLTIERCAIGEGTLEPSWDVVVCADVLEHVRDDTAAFRWLASCLRPGGHLVVHVPAHRQSHPLRSVGRAIDDEVASGRGPHLRMGYSPERLRELVSTAGLDSPEFAWSFHRRPARIAASLDTWTYLHGLRPLKLALLPGLLALGSVERRPSSTTRGNGLLLHARAPA